MGVPEMVTRRRKAVDEIMSKLKDNQVSEDHIWWARAENGLFQMKIDNLEALAMLMTMDRRKPYTKDVPA